MPSDRTLIQAAIAAHDLKKKYRLFSSPTERLKEALHPLRRQFHREFWALNGVTFDVPKGQTLGIIGVNGCGKSTLLQVIAGILQPTSGRLQVDGKIAALLELGAGFNPEFTGRDNVILNGAITGIVGSNMARRLPEIEAFADIGEFFDQPVKTYSSGMFVRLAFAVAINVDADILVIDEAFAVGDARFQNKCYERLRQFQKDGKTIILVTHDTAAVANHCDRAIVLDHGRIVFDGPPVAAIDRYFDLLYPARRRLQESSRAEEKNPSTEDNPVASAQDLEFWGAGAGEDRCHLQPSYNKNETRFGNGAAEIIDFLLFSSAGNDGTGFLPGSRIHLLVKVLAKQDFDRLIVGFAVKAVDGVEIYGTNTGSPLLNQPSKVCTGTIHFFEFSFEQWFHPSDYFVDIGIGEDDGSLPGRVIEVRRSLCHFVIQPPGPTPFVGLVDLKPDFTHHWARVMVPGSA